MDNINKIIFIRRDNIGDLVCTAPAIRAARLSFPGARISALVNTYNADAALSIPEIDEVFIYEKEKHSGRGRLSVFLDNYRVIRRVRAERFDVAIGCSYGYSERTARLTRLTGAKTRIGFSPAEGTSGSPLYNLTVAPPTEPLHEVEAMMRLLGPLGVSATPPLPPPFFLRPSPDEVKKAAERLEGLGIKKGGSKVAALHISTRRPENRWPRERFLELSEMIQGELGMRVLLLWSPGSVQNPMHPGDDETARWITDSTLRKPAALRTEKLSELIAALSLSDIAVCLDGGAMHIAAALGKPVVAIWGSTDKRRWAPWGAPCTILEDSSRQASAINARSAFEAFVKLASGNVIR